MKAAGVAFRRPACFPCSDGLIKINHRQYQSSSCASIPASSFGCSPVRARRPWIGSRTSEFRESGHLDFYCKAKKGGALVIAKGKKKETKKKLKLLQGLSKDLSTLTQMDTHLLGAQGAVISEAAQVLMKHLLQLQAEEKEQMRKEEEETPLVMADTESSSSSESSSSEDECSDHVIDIGGFKGSAATSVAAAVQPMACLLRPEESTSAPTLEAHGSTAVPGLEHHVKQSSNGEVNTIAGSTGRLSRRIEVCMGNKCKKSGSATLLEEFGKAVGGSGAVVGCKCMGKCRDGPNVRLFNCLDNEGADVSVTAPPNPVFLGVALEDVDIIVANLFAQEWGFNPSC